MRPAEALRDNLVGYAPKGSLYSRWVNDSHVEVVCLGERDYVEEITIPPPVDSKVLFLASAKIPNSDRLQLNLGRALQRLRANDNFFRTTLAVERSTDEQVLLESAKMLSRISHETPDALLNALRQMFFSLRQHSDTATEPEIVLESFEGYVDQIDGDTAYVTLESRKHGDVLYGEYSASQLRQKGIGDQSRFLCKTVKMGRATRVEFEPLPDEEVTDEEVRAIAEKMNRAFSSDDSGIEY